MRPKQAVINNNIQRHTSQTGSTEDYRIRETNSKIESIVTRHVSAYGGKRPIIPQQQAQSARSSNPAAQAVPTISSSDIARGQSSLPLYNYNNSYYPSNHNSSVNYNNIPLQPNPIQQNSVSPLQPNQTFYYQDLNTGTYYVPYVDYNQYPPNQYQAPVQYTTYPYPSQQYVPQITDSQAQPQVSHMITYPTTTAPAILPITNTSPRIETKPSTDIELSPLAYDESYTDHSFLNQSRLIDAYSPEPFTSLYKYKPVVSINEEPKELDVNRYFPPDDRLKVRNRTF